MVEAIDMLDFLLCLWQMDVLFMTTGGEPFQKLEAEPLASFWISLLFVLGLSK